MKAFILLITTKFIGFIAFESIQIPTEVPHPDTNSPIDLSNPADIIIYIVLPIVVIVLFMIGRHRKKKS